MNNEERAKKLPAYDRYETVLRRDATNEKRVQFTRYRQPGSTKTHNNIRDSHTLGHGKSYRTGLLFKYW